MEESIPMNGGDGAYSYAKNSHYQVAHKQPKFTNREDQRKMEYIFPMNGGNGAYSYTTNSELQKEASDFMKLIIPEAIEQKLELKIPSTVRIADLGCSVGPNTFLAVQNLIQIVEDKFCESKNDLEFQVFFSDHSSNDFNTLFASFPPESERQYHAAGVPGSFHGRLFPRASITLAHSSYALHWLSRVPEAIISSNKGRIFYAGESGKEYDVVLNAYWEQFERDMGKFMSARAEEIVKGGLMFLMIPGIGDGATHADFSYATAFNLFHSSLTDLAAEGVIDKAEIEGFNFPFYFPNVEEMTKVIEDNGCFSIEKVELSNPRTKISARAIITLLRAGMEGIFTQHFGDSVMEKMFSKTLAKAQEASDMVEADLNDSTQLFYVLKRK